MSENDEMAAVRPLNAQVREALDRLSSSERKVGRAILANYPIAALGTVAELAERAGVSPPTVVRFVSRLGFSGYPAFQKQLVREVHERLGSPLEQYSRDDLLPADGDLGRAGGVFAANIAATIGELPPSEFERTVGMLSDARRVRLIGGRFSHLLAEYLGAHLMLLRGEVQVIGDDEFTRLSVVADTRRGDVIVVFDYRRYDPRVVRLAQRSAERGADLILFTDQWLSPAADYAATVLPANVEAPSPFDSLVGALAVVETVVAAVTDRLGEAGRQRLAAMEDMRGTPS